MNMNPVIYAMAAVALTLSPALWASDEPTDAPVAAEAAAEEASVPETLRHKDRPVTIMQTPLDGTSVDTFTAGLERISEEASEEEYRNVMSAVDYLLFYDIGARRDKARLYSRLNGKTPEQILEIVGNHRANATKKPK